MRLLQEEREKSVTKVWGHLKSTIALVPSTLDNGSDPATGLGELHAIALAHSVLRHYYKSNQVKIIDSRRWKEPTFEPSSEPSYIVLGSCQFNALAERLHGKVGDNPFFVLLPDGRHSVRLGKDDKPHDTSFMRNTGSPYEINTDYGVLVWRDNSNGTRTVNCIGAHTYGTYATAAVLFTKEFCEWYLNSGSPEKFELLVKISDIRGYYDQDDEHKIECIDGRGIQSKDLPKPIANPLSLTTVLEGLVFGIHYQRLKARARLANNVAGICFLAVMGVFLLLYVSHLLHR